MSLERKRRPEVPLDWLSRLVSPTSPVAASGLVGRREELRHLLVHLADNGAVPTVVGPPGIGKSSLLEALGGILAETNSALIDNDLLDCRPPRRDRIIISARCNDSMQNNDDLAMYLASHIGPELRDTGKDKKRFDLRSFSLESSVPGLKASGVWEGVQAAGRRPVDLLRAELDLMLSHVHDVIIMLDECEQYAGLPRILELTRQLGSERCRFVLAMRDQAVHQLATGSKGDYRWPARTAVGRLSREDVNQFFQNIATSLASLDVHWGLSIEAMNYVFRHSAGEPWYLQMLAHELLHDPDVRLERVLGGTHSPRSYYRVGEEDAQAAERRLVNSRLSGLHASVYDIIVAGAPKREELLRALAHFPGTAIPRSFVDLIAKRRIRSASDILNLLLASQGGVLVPVVGSGNQRFEFADHQFRVYCRLGPPSSGIVDRLAEQHVEAWESR